MRRMSKLDAAMLALGDVVLRAWEDLPEGGQLVVRKIDGIPNGPIEVVDRMDDVRYLEFRISGGKR
jgi:hypothetical protein